MADSWLEIGGTRYSYLAGSFRSEPSLRHIGVVEADVVTEAGVEFAKGQRVEVYEDGDSGPTLRWAGTLARDRKSKMSPDGTLRHRLTFASQREVAARRQVVLSDQDVTVGEAIRKITGGVLAEEEVVAQPYRAQLAGKPDHAAPQSYWPIAPGTSNYDDELESLAPAAWWEFDDDYDPVGSFAQDTGAECWFPFARDRHVTAGGGYRSFDKLLMDDYVGEGVEPAWWRCHEVLPRHRRLQEMIRSLDQGQVQHLWVLDDLGATAVDSIGGVDGVFVGSVRQDADPVVVSGHGAALLDGASAGVTVPADLASNTAPQANVIVGVAFHAHSAGGIQMLYEEGGSGAGTSMYLDGHVLRCGVWGTGIANTYLAHDLEDATAAPHTAVMMFAGGGNIRLYVDGEDVAFKSGVGGSLPGHGNPNGIGRVNGDTRLHDGTALSAASSFHGRLSHVWQGTGVFAQNQPQAALYHEALGGRRTSGDPAPPSGDGTEFTTRAVTAPSVGSGVVLGNAHPARAAQGAPGAMRSWHLPYGADARVALDHALTATRSSWQVVMWVQVDARTDGLTLLSFDRSEHYRLELVDGSLWVKFAASDGIHDVDTGVSLADGQPHLLVVQVSTASGVEVWVDAGNVFASDPAGQGVVSLGSGLERWGYVGANSEAGRLGGGRNGAPQDGGLTIADLAVWADQPVDEAAVEALWAAGQDLADLDVVSSRTPEIRERAALASVEGDGPQFSQGLVVVNVDGTGELLCDTTFADGDRAWLGSYRLRDALTVSQWVLATNWSLDMTVMGARDYHTEVGVFSFGVLSTDQLQLQVVDQQGATTALTTTASHGFDDFTWHHLAVSYSPGSGQAIFYVDGDAFEVVDGGPTSLRGDRFELFSGALARTTVDDADWMGTMGAGGLWPRVLSADEVRALHRESGWVQHDSSGNRHDLQSQGGLTTTADTAAPGGGPGSASLDGVDDSLVPEPVGLVQDLSWLACPNKLFTVQVWARWDGDGTEAADRGLFTIGADLAGQPKWRIERTAGNAWQGLVEDDAGNTVTVTGPPVETGAAVRVELMLRNPGTRELRLTVDGDVTTADASGLTGSVSPTDQLEVGFGPSGGWIGLVSDLAIWPDTDDATLDLTTAEAHGRGFALDSMGLVDLQPEAGASFADSAGPLLVEDDTGHGSLDGAGEAFGQAATFSSDATREVAVEAWVRPYVVNQDMTVLELVDGQGVEVHLGLRSTGEAALDIDGELIVGTTALTVGQWTHLAGDYSADTGAARLWVDGEQEASVLLPELSAAAQLDVDAVTVGSAPEAVDSLIAGDLQGDVAHVAWYPRLLRDGEAADRVQVATVRQVDVGGPTIGKLAVNRRYADDVLDELVDLANWVWYVDERRRLWAHPLDSRLQAGTIDGTGFQWQGHSAEVGNERYMNEPTVVGARQLTDPQTERFQADGVSNDYTLSFEPEEEPVVRVDRGSGFVEEEVGIKGLEPDLAWLWSKGDKVLSANQDNSLDAGDEVEVTYVGRFPTLYSTHDQGEQERMAELEGRGSGRWERKFDVPQTQRQSDIEKTAASKLDLFAREGRKLEFVTRSTNLKAGMLVHVKVDGLGLDDTMLVTDVGLSDQHSGTELWASVTLVVGPLVDEWADTIQRLRRSSETVVDLELGSVPLARLAQVSSALQASATVTETPRVRTSLPATTPFTVA